MHFLIFLPILLSPLSSAGFVSGVTFTLVNECAYTVWPGILSNAGSTLLGDGGFMLGSGQSSSLSTPSQSTWSGRFWGRTGCSFSSSTSSGTCSSGDCGGQLQCKGAGANPPATLAEFTIAGNGGNNAYDFYDISLVDGYNLPISITPQDGSGNCDSASCASNLNLACPSTLQVMEEGSVVACQSACEAFQSAEYCCSGAYANPSTCKPSSYSELFKSACPQAYSYAYDDPTSTFTCMGASTYTITFCPSSSLQQSSSYTNSSTSSSTPESTVNGGGIVAAQVYSANSSRARVVVTLWQVVISSTLIVITNMGWIDWRRGQL